MKLYGYFRSSAAFRVRIAFSLKGITPDDSIFVHLRQGEQRAPAYAAKNPQLLVPALEVDEGHVLAQSLAIMEYLDETWPQPPLLPLGAVARARVRALAMIAACEIHPLQNLRVLNHLRQSCGQDEAQATAWARHWNEVGLTAFEKSVAGHPDTGRYCHGDTPTLADICLVPQVFSAQRFGVDMAAYPTVMRIHQACMALPAFDQAQPAKQPDAEA
jgi:maleylacetoacetate isomerase